MKKVIIPDDKNRYNDVCAYQFSEKEFNIIFPMISKQLDKKLISLRKKVDYYEGLREIGATEKQLDKWQDYTDKLDFLEHVKQTINNLE